MKWTDFRENMARVLLNRAREDSELRDALLTRAARRLVDECWAPKNAKSEAVKLSQEQALLVLEKRAKGLGGVPKPIRQIGRLHKEGVIDDAQFKGALEGLGYEVVEMKIADKLRSYIVKLNGVEICRFKLEPDREFKAK